MRHRRSHLGASVFIVLLWALPAIAQTASGRPEQGAPANTGNPVPGSTAAGGPSPSAAAAGLWERTNLLGDWGGLQPLLGAYGISFGLTETSEVLGNPTGGRSQGLVYEGLTAFSVGADLGSAGGIVNISAFQIHGRGLSIDHVGNLATASSIEADRSTRLWEWWYQQSFLDGRFDIKIGQQGANLEFMTSQYAGLFINSSFGWPALVALDLPSGGAAYPLATPAVRLRVKPTDALTALLGVFNGDPAGPGQGDPQLRDASGTRFVHDAGVFVIGEVQYAINQGDAATGLPGTYKLGAWYNSNAFPDQFFANAPVAAGAPAAGLAVGHRNDWSVYGVMDQLVFRPTGSKDGGLGVFARATGAPGDRNLINVFLDAGVTYRGAFGRDNDTVGLGISWLRISDTARAGDAASAVFFADGRPVRGSETVVELTYQAQVAPWWIVQPDLQYVFNTGGGILNPNRPDKPIGDALILGVRTAVTF